ncbi:unnamed protein product [Periconia digitata]|uniref:Uncharacterized protein n=1 Tax=Periconia digitata TaxID=1303443 RepID=A0A9W4UJF2_9PLEO|nr:unnamed protein product [Periconia digitata]
MVEHSKTVRGTFSNPKYKASSIPPQLGDPVSLQRDKYDPVKSDSRKGSNNVKTTYEVNRSMLGDPVSLKAETSSSNFDLGAERSGTEKNIVEQRGDKGKSKL